MLPVSVVRAGLATFVAASMATAAPPVIVPGEATPDAVVALGPLEDASAFGVSADGAIAVAARPSERGGGRSVVRIGRSAGTAAELELAGQVVALAVSPAGDLAFLIVRETDKKGAIRRVVLVGVDAATARSTSQVALPVTANGLAFGVGQSSLLVGAKDELRTLHLPELTSGPLYRVSGTNGAVAPIAGTRRVLVAQVGRLVLVDLSSPQNRDGLPILESIEAAAEVRMLAASPDEPVGLALLADRTVVDVETEPLRLVPRGSASAIAWPGAPAPAPAPDTAVVPTAPPVAPAEVPVANATVQESPPPDLAAPAPAVPPQVAPPPSVDPGEPGTVHGLVSGPARDAVRQLTLLGPDNILREAARVVPDASGRYSVAGLRTGSYRIVAAGENGRVLVCEPPYVTVKVSSGATVEAPALDVRKAH